MSSIAEWMKLKYPERAYSWIRNDVFYSDFFEDVEEKYNPILLHAVENYIENFGVLNEREKELYKLIIEQDMPYTAVAPLFGITQVRVRQLFMKASRKLYARKCVLAADALRRNIVNPVARELFIDPKRNCDADFYESSWEQISAIRLQNYIVYRLNEYAESEDEFVGRASIRNILNVIKSKGTTIEAIFNDIDYEYCEMMNRFFMEHPYIDPDDPESTIQQTLYIDYNEVLRHKKPVPKEE